MILRVAQIGVRTEELWNFVYLEKKKKRKKNPNFWKLRNKIVFLDSGRTENIDGLLGLGVSAVKSVRLIRF